MNVAVVVLNYNGKNHLQNFLPGLISKSPEAEVVVIDNASTDDSITFLNKSYPEIRIIPLETNYGFAKGYNEGLKTIDSDYYVIINSDVDVSEKWLMPMMEILDKNEEIAICQPKILDYSRKEYFEYAGAAGGYLDILGYPFCRGRVFNNIEKDSNQYNDSREIFWASGACMMIRSNIFWELGGFDEDFFAHMEEIDLCWRIQKFGKIVFYCAESKVFHIGGGTLKNDNPKKTYLNFRNGLFLLVKNLPINQLIWKLPVRLILDGVASLKIGITNGPKHVWAIIKAHIHFYKMFFRMFGKRRNGINQKSEMIFPGSIVFRHYILKKSFSDLKWIR